MNERQQITIESDWQYCVQYRFADDPEDMVREWLEPPVWNEKHNAYQILPAFPGKSVIFLGYGAVQK